MFDIQTAPVNECIAKVKFCITNAQTVGDKVAVAKLKLLLWALETEAQTGVFPRAKLDSKLNPQLN